MERVRPINAVLFDLDGTLIDSEPQVAAALHEAFRRHGRTLAYPGPFIGPPIEQLVGDLVGDSPEEARAVFEDYRAIYRDRYAADTSPLPGADALLDALAARGVRLAIVTNKLEAPARIVLQSLGWTGHFAAVVGADGVAHPKPDAEPALEAANRLGVPPGRAALVGDTEFDVRCGLAAGVALVVGVTTGPASEDALLEAGARSVVPDLAAAGDVLLRSCETGTP